MRKPRTFTSQFKREVVEELVSGTTGPAQLARRYNLSSGLLYHWKKQYARGKLNNEPIDIYVNPTYLPAEIDENYDELWTTERMDRVIKALVDNNVALEINATLRLPKPDFIKRAKANGVKFTFGTNNGGPNDLGRMEYCIDMVGECGLTPDDMWIPGK